MFDQKAFIIKIFSMMILYTSAPAATSNLYLQKADSLYAYRAEGFQPASGLVDTSNINRAIRCYQKSLNLADSTMKEKIYWKIMQCFYYKGNYTLNDKKKRKQCFRQGIDIGNRALEMYPNSPGLHFWMGILWGYWSEQVGLLTAGRKGVAGKVRHHAESLIAIQDTFAEGGAYRTLGRLHFMAPKIPLILGWPSKKKALRYFEKAFSINHENLFTKQYYAEALYDQGEKKQAIQMMKEILDSDKTVHGIAEDAFIKKEAEKFLNEHPE